MPYWSLTPEPRPASSLPEPSSTTTSTERAASKAPSADSSDDPISMPSASPRFPSTVAPRTQSYQVISRSAVLPPPRPDQDAHVTPRKIVQQAPSMATHSPALDAAKAASTTPKHRDSGMAKGTGPGLSLSSRRRHRPSVTYNLKELTYKARSPSKPSLPQKEPGADSVISPLSPRPSRSSTATPPVYNLKDLIGQTKMSRATQRAARKFMRKWDKDRASHNKTLKRPAQEDDQQNYPQDQEDDEHGDDQQLEADLQMHQQQPSKRQKIAQDAHVSATAPPPQPATTWLGPATVSGASDNAAKLISYLAPILRNRGVTDPYAILKLDWFKELLTLPQQRTIQWNTTGRPTTWSYRHKIDLSSLLIQITGERPPQPCERCASGCGLYDGCFVISSKINPGTIYGCANCLYNGRQTFCSLKEWGKSRSKLAPAAAAPTTTHGVNRASTASHNEVAKENPVTTATPVSIQHRQGAIQQDNQSAYASHQATSLVVTGVSTTSLRTMEPWEKAPGRIRSSASDRPENIAFSKSYLASGSGIQVCNEASFKIEVIRSGHSHRMPRQPGIMRLCSIAAGKLTVKMEQEEPFAIGPHGMFRIGPHTSCFVESDLYDDVVVHITSIQTDDD
ncbi:hypothetical protein BD289DRAFT_479604 [Coniella lustricola]|uniref:Uncharacterized protein n=1 Tax=Coniella lustricola TaxID=2025994 RepID=A0A2T3AIG6_9PEZI|nr:hypothetical protein BD289DRAFT_479604 [Coniella lustricola]